MQIRGLVFGAIVTTLSVTSASATMRISEDRGGQIGHYLQTFASLRSSGENVVVDGNCLSACTLVLGLVPREKICATQHARVGFHAAWMPDNNGRPVTSPLGTHAQQYRLTHEGGTDHDWLDAWLSKQLGAAPKPRLWEIEPLAHDSI